MNGADLTPKVMSLATAMDLPPKQKAIYFHNAKVLHANAILTLRELDWITTQNSGTQIVFLIGPPGAGKSYLIEKLKEQKIAENISEIAQDPSFIPVISVEAPSSGEKGFSWGVFYDRLGAALNEVLMDKKIVTAISDDRTRVRNTTTRSTIAGRREAVEAAIGYRRTSLIITDEAIHLIRDKEGNSLSKKMDTLKSLANIHDTTIVLVGSYDLYSLMNQYGQVARRSMLVHFPRYRSGDKGFKSTLSKLQQALPLRDVPDLTKYTDALMLTCNGCVGALKDTLKRTLLRCLKLHNGRWNEKALQKALISKAQVAKIYEEILDGEREIENASFGSNSLSIEV
jgi:hypothetical protein